MKRPVVLVICDYYLPGFESGGAMRTVVNMVERLSDEFEFRIITRDHDGPNNLTPYEAVAIDAWNTVGATLVYYLSQKNVRMPTLQRLIREVSPDAIYLNSFFSPLTVFTLTLRKRRQIDQIPVILAPEGEFSPGALQLKKRKKSLYIIAAKALGLLKGVIWKAGSEPEREDIFRVLSPGFRQPLPVQESRLKAGPTTPTVLVAPNMPPSMINKDFGQSHRSPKTPGSAKMVYLSRYMAKKNLNWLLRHLVDLKGKLSIDICGPIEDEAYWHEAETIIRNMPTNIEINSKGPVRHDRVAETLMDYHFFVLPTLGENFGHVFIEALAAGLPLVISDRTPWRDLEQKGIGWDLPLEDPSRWIAAVENCLKMDQAEFTTMSDTARRYAVEWLSDPSVEDSNRQVLRQATSPDDR